jgi:hypothetical protein
MPTPPADPHLSISIPNHVYLTVYPERPGLTVVAKPEAIPYPEYLTAAFGITPKALDLPVVVGITDNASRVLLPLIPPVPYNISVNGECTFKIFPTESSYAVYCNT